MLIYVVDDEPSALRSLVKSIREAEPDCCIQEYTWGQPMLDALSIADKKPDVVFLDIEMPGPQGIEVAKRTKLLSPCTSIVFVTGFSEYALDAFAVHARGYVLKPVSPQAVRTELDALKQPAQPDSAPPHIRIKTFGNFDILVDGEVLMFNRSKAKEMLAYLVHRMGAVCTTQEVAAILFEDRGGEKLESFYKIAQSLKQTLKAAECSNILRHSYRSYAVDTSLLDCDYYQFLSNPKASALNAYTGEYMAQYGWAEITNAYLTDKSSMKKGRTMSATQEM